MFLFASLALTIASCGGGSEEMAAEKVTYTLDQEASQLKWKGSENPEYFHTGSVKITEGTIEMEGDQLVSGNFTIDLNTIVAEDATLPAEKKEYLAAHLKDTSFFFVADFPKVDVKVSSYENGKLATTISVRGKEIKQDIPVTMTKDENSISFNGKFSVDFSALEMPGTQPKPGKDEHVLPTVDFEMNLKLNKK